MLCQTHTGSLIPEVLVEFMRIHKPIVASNLQQPASSVSQGLFGGGNQSAPNDIMTPSSLAYGPPANGAARPAEE